MRVMKSQAQIQKISKEPEDEQRALERVTSEPSPVVQQKFQEFESNANRDYVQPYIDFKVEKVSEEEKQIQLQKSQVSDLNLFHKRPEYNDVINDIDQSLKKYKDFEVRKAQGLTSYEAVTQRIKDS